jgi:hypothetical protein
MTHSIGYFTSSAAARFFETTYGSYLEELDWNGKLELTILLAAWVYQDDVNLSLEDCWWNLSDVDPDTNGPISTCIEDIPLMTPSEAEELLEAVIYMLRHAPKKAEAA